MCGTDMRFDGKHPIVGIAVSVHKGRKARAKVCYVIRGEPVSPIVSCFSARDMLILRRDVGLAARKCDTEIVFNQGVAASDEVFIRVDNKVVVRPVEVQRNVVKYS